MERTGEVWCRRIGAGTIAEGTCKTGTIREHVHSTVLNPIIRLYVYDIATPFRQPGSGPDDVIAWQHVLVRRAVARRHLGLLSPDRLPAAVLLGTTGHITDGQYQLVDAFGCCGGSGLQIQLRVLAARYVVGRHLPEEGDTGTGRLTDMDLVWKYSR